MLRERERERHAFFMSFFLKVQQESPRSKEGFHVDEGSHSVVNFRRGNGKEHLGVASLNLDADPTWSLRSCMAESKMCKFPAPPLPLCLAHRVTASTYSVLTWIFVGAISIPME